MLARLKPDPPRSDFQIAFAAYEAAKSAWGALVAEEEALKVAAIAQNVSDEDRAGDRFEWIRKKIAEHYGTKRMPAPWRIPDLSRELRERIELELPKWFAAQQEWEIARSKETSRLAIALQARQRGAVKKIAAAAEKLSEAMMEERELHDELARNAPNPASAYLPDCSPQIAGLDDWQGELFQWRRRMRELKLLD
jgi:hypothetical protein